MTIQYRLTVFLHFIVLVVGFLVGGCGQDKAVQPSESDAIEERLRKLEERVDQLESDLMDTSQYTLDLVDEYHAGEVSTSMDLNCESPRYSWLQYQSLAFPVVCEGAQQNRDGLKLQVTIGNPYSVEFSDVELKVSWKPGGVDAGFLALLGEDLPQELVDEESQRGNQQQPRTKTVVLDKALEAGAWNRSDVAISPASQGDRISIAMSIQTVALR